MFGYIKPHAPELKVKEYELYKSVYCGLCRSMKKKAGALCLTLSYDFVFLALIRMALEDTALSVEHRRCAVHPLKKRPMLTENTVLEYCAQASAMLTYHSVLDKINDGGFDKIKGIFSYIPAKHMYKKCALPLELSDKVSKNLALLSEYEREKGSSADQAAEYFGTILSDVFAYGLCGDKAQIAHEIGRHTGRWIYLIDALDDRASDEKSGNYNPVNLGGYTEEQIKTALNMEICKIERAVDLISFSDRGIENVVKNIVCLGTLQQLEAVGRGKKEKTGDKQ